ncbi:MAG: hypothetical protein DWB99_01120 [Candidatus Poseidoniales archaeon]|nr:MAG: hypothetical protein DWB99_01120 [Candidatus Poseidoniales archaeon]
MFDLLNKKYLISIERLHLIAGFSLVLSGIMVYFIDGIEMALSWGVFGAMYISMSDIGEDDMSEEKRNQSSHSIRRLFGYAGASFSLVLVFYYLTKII